MAVNRCFFFFFLNKDTLRPLEGRNMKTEGKFVINIIKMFVAVVCQPVVFSGMTHCRNVGLCSLQYGLKVSSLVSISLVT